MAPRQPVKDDSPLGSTFGILVPAVVLIAVAIGYVTLRGSDNQFNQAQTQPPVTQPKETPKANPDPVEIKPEAEKKPPPAAVTPKDTDPRVDSQNAN